MDLMNEDNWTSPRTLALLSAGAGFLDPKGGMSAGMQGAIQGLMAGRQLQQQNMLAKTQQQKIMKDMEARQLLQSTIDQQAKLGKTDPRSIGNALIATGHPDLIAQGLNFIKASPKAKSAVKVMQNGQAVYQPLMDSGEFGQVNDLPAAEKLMQINQGSQVGLANPYTGQIQSAVGVGMSPGESARLAQSAQQHNDSMGIQNQRLALDKRNMAQPKFVDGAWVTPPNTENPQGGIIPTEMYTPPKGSTAEKTKASAKVGEILGNDTADLIKASTGSILGTGVDLAARGLGVATPGAQAIGTLKIRTAHLAGNVPRFEGPQSNADRDYYVSMVGQLDDSTIPVAQRLKALDEVKRINNLVKPDGSVDLRSNGGANGSFENNGKKSSMSNNGFSVRRLP